MDKLVSLCKRRGFIFQSSEIYGGAGYIAAHVIASDLGAEVWWRPRDAAASLARLAERT